MRLVLLIIRGETMPTNDIQFSQFADAFYNIIYGKRCNKDTFVKELLKLGQSEAGKIFINEMFPSYTSANGRNAIEKNKADMLRKYLRGDNGISDIAFELYANFDIEIFISELSAYEISNLNKFAKKFNLYKEDRTQSNLQNIGVLYESILENASKSKGKSVNKTSVTNTDDNVVNSYIITSAEKQASVNMCSEIKHHLNEIKHLTDKIVENEKLSQSTNKQKWQDYLNTDLNSFRSSYDKSYSALKKSCKDLTNLLSSKKHLNKSIENIIQSTNAITEDKFTITKPKFNYSFFSLSVSQLSKYINQFLSIVDAF